MWRSMFDIHPPRPRNATWTPSPAGMSDSQLSPEPIPGFPSQNIKSDCCRSTCLRFWGISYLEKSNKSIPFPHISLASPLRSLTRTCVTMLRTSIFALSLASSGLMSGFPQLHRDSTIPRQANTTIGVEDCSWNSTTG